MSLGDDSRDWADCDPIFDCNTPGCRETRDHFHTKQNPEPVKSLRCRLLRRHRAVCLGPHPLTGALVFACTRCRQTLRTPLATPTPGGTK